MLSKLVFVSLCVALVLGKTVPSFDDEEEYDLVMLSEQEGLGAIPAHMRLNPDVYASAEEAKKAAEAELSKLGDAIDTPENMKTQAESEALGMAAATQQDPMHADLTGIKVDLGAFNEDESPVAADAVPPAATRSTTAAPAPKDTQSELSSRGAQASAADVPVIKHVTPSKPMPKSLPAMVQATELLPDAEKHLLEEVGSRPSAPQFGGGMMGYPQMGFPQMGQMGFPQQQFGYPMGMMPAHHTRHNKATHGPQLQAPDLDENTQTLQQQQQAAVPQYRNLFPPTLGLFQQQQQPMQQPAQMPQFMQQMPLTPQKMPEMMQQMTQMLNQQGASVIPAPDSKPIAQMPPQNFNFGQAMQNMPQMLPQMMHMMPTMMGQMSQGMLSQMPQVLQQVPQMMHSMPKIPGFESFNQQSTPQDKRLEEEEEMADSIEEDALPVAVHHAKVAHKKVPAPVHKKAAAHKPAHKVPASHAKVAKSARHAAKMHHAH